MRNIKDAVDHLPAAAVLIVDGITWEQYENLGLDERAGLRTTYDKGRLEIVSSSPGHERRTNFITLLVHTLAEILGLKVESAGGATQKKKSSQRAVEPDVCFYVQNIERALPLEDPIDLEVDPAPDIVVEIDKAGQSLNKFPIYAEFGIPEIWRYDVRRKRAQIFELANKSYVTISFSRFFPMLTTEVLAQFVEQSRNEGQTAALRAFRDWVKKQV